MYGASGVSARFPVYSAVSRIDQARRDVVRLDRQRLEERHALRREIEAEEIFQAAIETRDERAEKTQDALADRDDRLASLAVYYADAARRAFDLRLAHSAL